MPAVQRVTRNDPPRRVTRALSAAAALGTAVRCKDPEAVAEARRDLLAAKIADYAEKLGQDWSPLSEDQIATIVALLRNGAAS